MGMKKEGMKMRVMKKTLTFVGMVLILLIPALAGAYTVNGSLDDWGVTPGPFGSSDWIPNPGVYYTEEDQNTYPLGPGYGGQSFDAEAMYIDFDTTNLYFAIVTGFPYSGTGGYQAGDIGFDFGVDKSYEYGIETTGNGGFTQGSLYSVSNWGQGLNNWGYGNVGYLGAPTEMITAALIYDPSGTNLVYNNTYYSANEHYVIEGLIPQAYFGSDWGKSFRTHWTMTCGNDFIYKDIPAQPVPEPGTLMLFGTGILGLLAGTFRKFFRQIKKGMDLLMAGVGIILTLPLWGLIAIAIKLDSKGPVLLKQERIGENRRSIARRRSADLAGSKRQGKERRITFDYGLSFTMYKFRSMYEDAEKMTGPVWAEEKDPRITRVGYFLRKTHLDELPQLINVLNGDMSIIGPRPERRIFVEQLTKEIKKYHKRLKVKPGITGLAQVRQHYDVSLQDVKKKVHYDLLYIRRMCLMMDLRIIFGTFVVMLTGKGAR